MALVAAGALRSPPPPATPAVVTPLGRLTVLDGDTLRLPDGRRVRLRSVDTPELGRPFAGEARAFTAAPLAAGRELRLVPDDPPHDRYGRLLADVLIDGESLCEALLSAGLATVYDDDSPRLARLQAQAVAARAGMHSRLDRAVGPFVVTAHRFHRPGCPFARGNADLCSSAADALAAGLSPCRNCLAWPP